MKLERTGFALVLAAPFALWAAPARSDPDAADAVGGKGAGDAADGDDLSRDALAILAKRCAGCHGGPSQGVDADRGGFEHVLDVRELVADGQVVPYAPDESLLLARLVDGEMPPKEVADRPTDAEIATLRAWIAGGARPPRAETSGDVAERVFVTDGDVDRWIAADLAAASRRERRHYRYVGFVHLYDAGVSDDELDLARQALAKLVNSLSWKPEVSVPVAVDERHIVYRLDLRELGWTRALWTEISELDPYAVVRTSADARAAYAATGTFVPYVRGDWLVATASRPPLYHRILAVPGNARALQARLGVDLAGDVAAGRAARAGFNGSGVSQHNRVIERHDADGGGYYWQSFDFANSSGRHNIFEHPLTYSHDGSEIIFSLPNGLQGYMLTDAAGDRIDRALTTIVTDPSRADRTVENGISCMGCHAAGLIRKDDQVRPHLEANRAAFASQTVTDALALYRAKPSSPAAAWRPSAGSRSRRWPPRSSAHRRFAARSARCWSRVGR